MKAARRALERNLAPLGHRSFALYWIGQVFSNTGRWMEITGGLWLVFELTGSPVLLGLFGLFRGVAGMLVGPLAGVLADRVDQRRLLVVTEVLGALASLSLGVLVATGRVELWQIYLQTALLAGIESFDVAARQALFPRLVPRVYRAEAVALTVTAGRTAKLLGPALGGIAIAHLGVASPFLLDAVTYFVLIGALLWMRGYTSRVVAGGASVVAEMVDGFRHIMRAPVLIGVLQVESAFALFSMNAVIITIIGRQVLEVGPEGLGGLLSAPGLGSLIGIGGVLTLGQPPRQGRVMLIVIFAYAATVLAFAFAHDYAIAFGVLVLAGVCEVFVSVAANTIMHLATPGRMRGRVMANLRIVSRSFNELSQTQSGLLAGVIGGPLAVVAAAAILTVCTGLSARGNPALWGFSRDEAPVDAPTRVARAAAMDLPE